MIALIADKLPTSGLEALAEAGFEVIDEPDLQTEALPERLRHTGALVLIVRSTKVPAAALQAGVLNLVIRAGAGTNNIDVDAASRLGIYVSNCPGKNAIAVAELTWGLISSVDRRIPDCVRELREGRWNKKEFSKARGLFGRTLGVIGLGEIGRQVVERAAAFGMPVVAWSRSLTPAKARALGVVQAESLDDLARRSDVVSVHLALTDQTRGIIGARFFDAMKQDATFINTSRGAVVDAGALAEAIRSKGIRAGLDVWAMQPSESVATFEDPLRDNPAVFGTPHIGASTEQAQEAVAAEAVRVAVTYRSTGEVLNCVNLRRSAPAPCTLVVRHLDRVGVLAHVLQQLKASAINVSEMHNVLFSGADGAACATIQVSAAPDPSLLDRIAGHEHILGVRLVGV